MAGTKPLRPVSEGQESTQADGRDGSRVNGVAVVAPIVPSRTAKHAGSLHSQSKIFA